MQQLLPVGKDAEAFGSGSWQLHLEGHCAFCRSRDCRELTIAGRGLETLAVEIHAEEGYFPLGEQESSMLNRRHFRKCNRHDRKDSTVS